jgi:hypothetical protein
MRLFRFFCDYSPTFRQFFLLQSIKIAIKVHQILILVNKYYLYPLKFIKYALKNSRIYATVFWQSHKCDC